jgi:hypothetical protein
MVAAARYLCARTDDRAPKNLQGRRARSSMSKTGFMAWQILPRPHAIKAPAIAGGTEARRRPPPANVGLEDGLRGR